MSGAQKERRPFLVVCCLLSGERERERELKEGDTLFSLPPTGNGEHCNAYIAAHPL